MQGQQMERVLDDLEQIQCDCIWLTTRMHGQHRGARGMQGQQMERVLDDLEQIHFSMKKANQVLRDMTRGIATDRRAGPRATHARTGSRPCPARSMRHRRCGCRLSERPARAQRGL